MATVQKQVPVKGQKTSELPELLAKLPKSQHKKPGFGV